MLLYLKHGAQTPSHDALELLAPDLVARGCHDDAGTRPAGDLTGEGKALFEGHRG
jgi:hypothetical protein